MQSLYAFKGHESDDLVKDEKFLLHSLDGMLDLYLSIIALLTELHSKSKDYNKKLQKNMAVITMPSTNQPPLIMTSGIAREVQNPPPIMGSCNNCL